MERPRVYWKKKGTAAPAPASISAQRNPKDWSRSAASNFLAERRTLQKSYRVIEPGNAAKILSEFLSASGVSPAVPKEAEGEFAELLVCIFEFIVAFRTKTGVCLSMFQKYDELKVRYRVAVAEIIMKDRRGRKWRSTSRPSRRAIF